MPSARPAYINLKIDLMNSLAVRARGTYTTMIGLKQLHENDNYYQLNGGVKKSVNLHWLCSNVCMCVYIMFDKYLEQKSLQFGRIAPMPFYTKFK